MQFANVSNVWAEKSELTTMESAVPVEDPPTVLMDEIGKHLEEVTVREWYCFPQLTEGRKCLLLASTSSLRQLLVSIL